MNTLLVFVLFAGACMADVSHIVEHKPAIEILKSTQDSSPDGEFNYAYETANGISVQAQGSPSGDAQGSYRYTSSDGQPIEVVWSAGPNGFVAQGNAIPATPEHVLRTLEFNAAHPYKEPAQ